MEEIANERDSGGTASLIFGVAPGMKEPLAKTEQHGLYG